MSYQKDLSEESIAYRKNAHIYQLFSQCEDFPDLVFNRLSHQFKDKTVLDLGCGNGKYSSKISNVAKEIFSLDKSYEQLKLIDNNKNNIFPILSDASRLPLSDNLFDVVFASWVFGTILCEEKRNIALNEAKRILKPSGKLILIENAIDSEFENLRGRSSHKDNRTEKYNNWLTLREFKVMDKISSYFKFNNKEEAQMVFSTIWGERLTQKINREIIKHDILIFEFIK